MKLDHAFGHLQVLAGFGFHCLDQLAALFRADAGFIIGDGLVHLGLAVSDEFGSAASSSGVVASSSLA